MIFNFDSLSFQILEVAYARHLDGKFNVKSRPFAALSFRIKGTGEIECDGKKIIAKAGDVVFFPAGKEYKAEYLGNEFIVVHVLNCNYNAIECISLSDTTEIEQLFRNMHASWKNEHSHNKTKSYIYEILYKLSLLQTTSDTASSKALDRCIRYIDENFCEKELTVDSVCKYCYVSRASLQRYFLKYVGSTPKQYIIKLRMNKAIDLLSHKEYSIAEISGICGFEDEKYFSRLFKQTYGLSPSRIRQRALL